MKKGILGICLTLALCLGLLPTTALAASGDTYLALGDSITTGYAPNNTIVSSPFADQVAAAQGYTLVNEAADGETSETLKNKLTGNTINVSDAALITITIGGNDLMDALYGYLVEQYNAVKDPDAQITLERLKAALSDLSQEENQQLLLGVMSYISGFDNSLAETEALTAFENNLTAIITEIQTKNAGATIVIATQYNPYSHIKYPLASSIVTAFENGVVKLNQKINQVAASKSVLVADVYQAFQNGTQLTNAYVNSLIPMDAELDFHPNQTGHNLITKTINGVLPERSYDLWVGGIQVTSLNYTDVLGDGTVSYDATTNTLTLNGAEIDTYTKGHVIHSKMNELTIQIVGENNTITAASGYWGIRAESGSLTLTGDGKLTVNAKNSQGISAAEDLTITGAAHVTADARDIALCSDGGAVCIDENAVVKSFSETYYTIYAQDGDIDISGSAQVYGEGYACMQAGYYYDDANYGYGDIRISGNAVVSSISTSENWNGLYTPLGNIEISGTAQVTTESYFPAIYAGYDVSITGGTVSAVSISDCAIWAEEDLEISGENTVVNTYIEEADGTIRYSCGGIVGRDDLTIDGGTVNAYAECAEETDRYCIRCDNGTFSVSDGTVNAVVQNEPQSGYGNPAIYCGKTINFTGGQINASSRLHCAIEVYGYKVGDAVSYITGDAVVNLTSYYRDSLNCGTDLVISGNAVVEANSGTSSGISGNNKNITIEGNAQVKTFSEVDPALYVGNNLIINGPAQVYAESETDSGIKVWETLTIQDGANVTALGGIAVNNSQNVETDIVDIQNSILTVSSDEDTGDFVNINKNGIGTFSIKGSWVHMSRKDEEVAIADSVVFYDTSGTVIGNAVLPGNAALASGETLTVPEGAALILPDGKKLENNGSLQTEGIMEVGSAATFTGPMTVSGKVYVFETDGGANPVEGASFTLSGSGEVYAQLTGLTGTTIQPAARTSGSYPYTPVNGSEETFTNRWSYSNYVSSGTSTPSYGITAEDADNGSVTLSHRNAAKGTTVTITVKPNEGYTLNTLTVTDKDGKTVELTKVSDTQYTFKMSASKVTVKAAFEKEEPINTLPFTDVIADDWFYEAVKYVYDNGMMNGTASNRFDPNTSLSRGMIAQVLHNLEQNPAAGSGSFTDVTPGAWYADAVNWAASQGIVDGYGNGQFGPEDNVTREQLASILYRYAQHKGYDVSVGEDTNILSYTDAFEVSEWAVPAIQWACGAGIINGTGDGSTLTPQGNATRAQVATMLMRFCGYYDINAR